MRLIRETPAYHGLGAIAQVPARSRQARFLHATRDRLTAAVGQPNELQALLIERATMCLYQLELLDIAGRDGNLSNTEIRAYRQFTDTVAHLLSRLGITAGQDTEAAA